VRLSDFESGAASIGLALWRIRLMTQENRDSSPIWGINFEGYTSKLSQQ